MKFLPTVFLALSAFLFVSCGIIKSTTSINEAEKHRKKTLAMLTAEFGEKSIETDNFGNKSLKPDAAEEILPIKNRKAAYFFYKGDAYLAKAYDFRSRSIYDSAEYLADKSADFYSSAFKALGKDPSQFENVEPVPVAAPAPQEAPKPAPAAAPAPKEAPKPAPAAAPAPQKAPEPAPAAAPAPQKEAAKAAAAPAKKQEAEKEKEEPASLLDDYERMKQQYLNTQQDKTEGEEGEEENVEGGLQ